jgi:recombination protein RecA
MRTKEPTEKKEPKGKDTDTNSVLNEINKKFGEGTIIRLGDKPNNVVETLSTGVLGIDHYVLGVGGFARGRMSELYGAEGVGKSFLCLSAIADAQRKGYKAAFIDAEGTLDLQQAICAGVNVDDLFISSPDSGNDALTIAELLIKSDQFQVVVLDSVAALVPVQETVDTFNYGDSLPGLHARLMSQACRRLNPLVGKHNVWLLLTNQVRETMSTMGYGDNLITTGGRALRFYASQRLDIKRVQQLKTDDVITGHRIKVRAPKNKVGVPFREHAYDVSYGENSVKLNELIEEGVEEGILKRSGAYYFYNEQNIGQGAAKAKAYLLENPEVLTTIEGQVIEKLKIRK